MPGTFRLSVVTPEREVLAVEARFAALPAYDGEVGVLAKRAPLLTQLGSGLLRVEEASGEWRELFVSGGFAQMVDDRLTLLTEEARPREEAANEAADELLARALGLEASSDGEFAVKDRALARARALRRLQR